MKKDKKILYNEWEKEPSTYSQQLHRFHPPAITQSINILEKLTDYILFYSYIPYKELEVQSPNSWPKICQISGISAVFRCHCCPRLRTHHLPGTKGILEKGCCMLWYRSIAKWFPPPFKCSSFSMQGILIVNRRKKEMLVRRRARRALLENVRGAWIRDSFPSFWKKQITTCVINRFRWSNKL